MSKKELARKIIGIAIVFVAIPALIAAGVWLFNDRKYVLVSVLIAIVSLIPFLAAFEKKKNTAREIVIVATMTAISVVGRLIFAPVPGFKPVTAIVIITGVALGAEAGFVTGSMSALVSNIFFGQGPWTPFQMFSWGIIGFLSGIMFFGRRYNMPVLAFLGVFSGVLYSLLMDVWTTLAMSGEFVWQEYLLNVASAAPVTLEYVFSNVVFLLVLTKPFMEKLNRIKVKYDVFGGGQTQDILLLNIVKPSIQKSNRIR